MGRRDPDQPSLFGDAPAAPSRRASRRVGPAEVAPELAELAEALAPVVRFGTSSWSFPGWEGLVYDREAKPAHLARYGLEAYARHPLLRAVGLDRTYYAPIPARAFADYRAVVPDGFRFLVKAASACTDPRQRDEHGRPTGGNELFLDAGFASEEIVGPMLEGLGPDAGALVFQFPPQPPEQLRDPRRFAERLGGFLADLPSGPLYAVELRDRRLFGDDYIDALAATGVRHCYTAHPRMPTLEEQHGLASRLGAGPLVGRWNLHAGLGYQAARDRYEPFSDLVDEDRETRAAFADLCVEQIVAGQPVIITANNKAEGSAPLTIQRLAREVVARHPPPTSGT